MAALKSKSSYNRRIVVVDTTTVVITDTGLLVLVVVKPIRVALANDIITSFYLSLNYYY